MSFRASLTNLLRLNNCLPPAWLACGREERLRTVRLMPASCVKRHKEKQPVILLNKEQLLHIHLKNAIQDPQHLLIHQGSLRSENQHV